MTKILDAIRSFVGQWHNTASETLWLRGFNLAQKDGQLTIHLQGISAPLDWGEHPVERFRFHGNESAFYSCFELMHPEQGQMAVDFMAYTNKGLIVVAAHLAFADAPGRNHLSREFFVPAISHNDLNEGPGKGASEQ
jgi:hypothetical protein